MTRHDDTVPLRHMLDHAREALELGQGKSAEDVEGDRVLNLALVRLLEIIGEAATRVTENTRSQQEAIPWREIIAMRNRVIHGYDSVDFRVLVDVIRHDLPPLIETLEAMLGRD